MIGVAAPGEPACDREPLEDGAVSEATGRIGRMGRGQEDEALVTSCPVSDGSSARAHQER